MSVSQTLSAPLRLCALAALLLLCSPLWGVKGVEPPMRLPMVPLGFQPPPLGGLPGSGAQATVHFIDEQHLLVTFNVRRLMKRIPDDPPDDQDRTVEAVVVHLPSGKVLARTHWRFHDGAQYLWGLGHGRFLLRIRDTLTTFEPLVNLAAGDAFAEQPFLKSSRRIDAVLLSPDRDLVTIETTERPVTLPAEGALPKRAASLAQLNFYRLLQPTEPAGKMIVQAAGAAVSEGLVNLSITTAGHIEVLQESATRWLFDFDPYAGKFVELSPFDSTCRPRPVFVSASEFVAFGCMGGNERLAIGGFNMRGEQMWQQNFTDLHAYPNFAFAPGAGRFALSRNVVASNAGITVDFAPESFTTQEIRVYQTYNGKQLLRVEATPVQRGGGNYDLSPDGLRFAVIREQAIEVHRLPALTEKDEKEVQTAKALQPKPASAYVTLAGHGKPGGKKVEVAATPQTGGETVLATPAVVATKPVEEPLPTISVETPAGDPVDQAPRKPPTLYTLPGDKPPAKPQ